MKKILGLLMILSLTTSCKRSKTVDVFIEQNGKLIKPSKGIVTLNKEEFNVIFNLPEPMGVLVNASFNDEILNLASEGKELTTRSEFFTIAIALLNPEKTLYVSEDSSSPWFYENEEEHNFNKIEIENGNYRCTRSIKNIANVESEISIEVGNIDTPIYLVFVPISDGEKSTDEIRVKENHLKIEWRK